MVRGAEACNVLPEHFRMYSRDITTRFHIEMLRIMRSRPDVTAILPKATFHLNMANMFVMEYRNMTRKLGYEAGAPNFNVESNLPLRSGQFKEFPVPNIYVEWGVQPTLLVKLGQVSSLTHLLKEFPVPNINVEWGVQPTP